MLGDLQLIIRQLEGQYKCWKFTLVNYYERALELLNEFDNVSLKFVPRQFNQAANELAQVGTSVVLKYGVREQIFKVERRTLPSFMAPKEENVGTYIATLDDIDTDWRQQLFE